MTAPTAAVTNSLRLVCAADLDAPPRTPLRLVAEQGEHVTSDQFKGDTGGR